MPRDKVGTDPELKKRESKVINKRIIKKTIDKLLNCLKNVTNDNVSNQNEGKK